MQDLELILTGPAAQDAARDLPAALALSGLQPRPLEDADAAPRKAIDPVTAASLALTIPGTVLAVMDIAERIADRIVRRRRAPALVETAARLETDAEDLETRVERLEQRPDPSARAES